MQQRMLRKTEDNCVVSQHTELPETGWECPSNPPLPWEKTIRNEVTGHPWELLGTPGYRGCFSDFSVLASKVWVQQREVRNCSILWVQSLRHRGN